MAGGSSRVTVGQRAGRCGALRGGHQGGRCVPHRGSAGHRGGHGQRHFWSATSRGGRSPRGGRRGAARRIAGVALHRRGVGNPHCVILADEIGPDLAQRLGPLIEARDLSQSHNVLFVKVIDRSRIRLEIWERGAGYTLAFGQQQRAAAAACVRLGKCDGRITVEMPGGELNIAVRPSSPSGWSVRPRDRGRRDVAEFSRRWPARRARLNRRSRARGCATCGASREPAPVKRSRKTAERCAPSACARIPRRAAAAWLA